MTIEIKNLIKIKYFQKNKFNMMLLSIMHVCGPEGADNVCSIYFFLYSNYHEYQIILLSL